MSIAHGDGRERNFKDEMRLFVRLANGLYNAATMEYTVKFLESSTPEEQRCHMYVGQERLSLVADWGTPWLTGNSGKVQFARPSGDVIASLEFPGLESKSKGGQPRISYALIYDHAVYALFTKRPWPDQDEEGVFPYFEIEAEGQTWLALGEVDNGRVPHKSFTLCDAPPANLRTFARPLDICGDDPAGQIVQLEQGAFRLNLPDGRFRQPQLILFALTFLIHQLA